MRRPRIVQSAITSTELAVKVFLAGAATMFSICAMAAPPHDTAAGEPRFRDLYKQLVETNTSLSARSGTLAAERMAAQLRAAGFPDTDLHPHAASDHPKEGGLVAVYRGRDPQLRAILLLAHIDGVEPVFLGPDIGHIHGLDEYVGVMSLLEGREFLYRLVKIYAERK